MNGENVKGAEKKWLIKSATRILGPFTLSEITEHLKSRHISIIDEIRTPEGRWSYIRENQIFLDIVKNLHEEQDPHSEKTMTQSIAQYTMTRTDSNASEDPKNQTNGSGLNSPSTNDNLKDVTPIVSGAPIAKSSAPVVAKNYGVTTDTRVQNKIKQKSNFWRWMVITASALTVSLVVIMALQKDRKKNVGHEELISKALRYKAAGLYGKSLDYYLKASKLKEANFDTQIQMAPVLISEDRQSLSGRRILQRALVQEGRSRSETVEAYLGIAVSYIMDGDLKQAEDILQKAIGYEPTNVSALLNLGIIHLKKGNYTEALKEFDSIYRKSTQPALALFGRALAAVEYSKVHLDTSILLSLIEDIKSNLQKSNYLKQELLLFNVYAFHLLNDVNGLNQAVIEFLNQTVGQTRNYVHPLQVEWRFTQWDYLEKYCAEIYEKQSLNPELKALRAVCLMEVNRDGEAAKLLQEASAEAPRDPYVLTTQASYLVKVGRFPEAMAILKMPELGPLLVKNFLIGDVCMKTQDLNCAKAAFTEINNTVSTNGTALYGLAWSAMLSNDRVKAYDYVRTGINSEPNFLPLLELRDQLESQ